MKDGARRRRVRKTEREREREREKGKRKDPVSIQQFPELGFIFCFNFCGFSLQEVFGKG